MSLLQRVKSQKLVWCHAIIISFIYSFINITHSNNYKTASEAWKACIIGGQQSKNDGPVLVHVGIEWCHDEQAVIIAHIFDGSSGLQHSNFSNSLSDSHQPPWCRVHHVNIIIIVHVLIVLIYNKTGFSSHKNI